MIHVEEELCSRRTYILLFNRRIPCEVHVHELKPLYFVKLACSEQPLWTPAQSFYDGHNRCFFVCIMLFVPCYGKTARKDYCHSVPEWCKSHNLSTWWLPAPIFTVFRKQCGGQTAPWIPISNLYYPVTLVYPPPPPPFFIPRPCKSPTLPTLYPYPFGPLTPTYTDLFELQWNRTSYCLINAAGSTGPRIFLYSFRIY